MANGTAISRRAASPLRQALTSCWRRSTNEKGPGDHPRPSIPNYHERNRDNMDSIVSRINKLLALGERGGTEAEATAAMRKVHELLAKHNLSLDDVKDSPVA